MFDAVTLAAVTDELNDRILHGRVQEIVQLDALTFGLEVYAEHRRHYLYITAHPDNARLHLVSQKLRGSGQAASPLLLLLRKYAENALIHSIAQLPHERVIKLQLDHSVEGISTLVVETIGKYSNIILVDADGIVVDALKRITAEVNRARVILPRRSYVPPPPQSKLELSQLTASDFESVLSDNEGAPLRQLFVKLIAGVSPLLASQVMLRLTGRLDAPSHPMHAARALDLLRQLGHAPWQPCVAYEDQEPAAFAPYPLLQFTETRSFESVSKAIEEFFGAPESYAAAKEALRGQLVTARDHLARKRDALTQSLPFPEEIERLRTGGELILAHSSEIQPAQAVLHAETMDGPVDIPLNPSLSAVDNAQRYFKDYHRAKDAAARVPALLANANAQVDYAEQMLNDLDLAENRAEIEEVVRAAREASLLSAAHRIQRVKLSQEEPRQFKSGDGFTILVGKNARQNEEITFRRAREDDLWLHARSVAGAHVIIVRAGREIPESTIQEAAILAAKHSQARDETTVDVIVTPRRNVHRLRGGRTGMVTVRDSSTRTIRL